MVGEERRAAEVGRARMAVRQTPTECELNPIFPTIPGWTRARVSGGTEGGEGERTGWIIFDRKSSLKLGAP